MRTTILDLTYVKVKNWKSKAVCLIMYTIQPVLVYFWWPIPSHTRTHTHCSQLIHGSAMKEIPVITRLWLHLCRTLTCLCQLWRQHTLLCLFSNFLLPSTGNTFMRIPRSPCDTMCSEISKSLLRLCFLCSWSLRLCFLFLLVKHFLKKKKGYFYIICKNLH